MPQRTAWRDGRRLTRRDFLGWTAAVGAGVGMSPLLMACNSQSGGAAPQAGASGGGQPKRGGVLHFRATNDPPDLDIAIGGSPVSAIHMSRIYSRLLTYKPNAAPNDLSPAPDLAEKWDVSQDGKTYTFKLRQGVKWHNLPPVNGRELVADDVKYSLERVMDPANKSPIAYLLAPVAGIETPDKYTVRITTKEPYAPLISNLAGPWMYIVAKEAVQEFGDLKQRAIGTGPFMLDNWQRGARLVYKRHPNYFLQGKPYLDGLEDIIVTDSEAVMAAMRSGQLDVGLLPSYTASEALKKDVPGIKIYEFPIGVWCPIVLDVSKPPFSDLKVRTAVDLAINRPRVMKDISEGKAVLNGPLPTALGDWALPADEISKLYEYNPTKAKQLLAEAGYANGFEFPFTLNAGQLPWVKETFQAIISDLKDVGITAKVDTLEYAAYWSAMGEKKVASTFGFFPMLAEPDQYLSGYYQTGGARNYAKVADPKLDEMIKKQRETVDRAARVKAVQDIQRYVAPLRYYIPVAEPVFFRASQPSVRDYYPHLDYGDPSIAGVWLDK
jgi:peptide/nickel transport system substrate-binding protein